MKLKKIVLGVIALSLVATLTTGCGQKAELKNGSEVAVKVDGAKITADEYYNEIKTNNVSTLIDMKELIFLTIKLICLLSTSLILDTASIALSMIFPNNE